jgi:hypothetical protein
MAAQVDLNDLVAFRGQLDQWVAEVGPARPDTEDVANARDYATNQLFALNGRVRDHLGLADNAKHARFRLIDNALGRIDPRQEGIDPGQEDIDPGQGAGPHDVGAGPNLVIHQPFFELAQAVFGQEAAQRRRAAQLQDKMARL